MADVKSLVTEQINGHKVLVISKSYCPHCKRAKAVLKKLKDIDVANKSEYFEWEIEDLPNCKAIQTYLGKLTGASTVPRVFVNGQFLGGADDTVAAVTNGKISKMLKN